jgi:uncharacterized protein (TIGR03643 family)
MLFSESEESKVVKMTWEDRIPFEAIEDLFGLNEQAVITLMCHKMKSSSFKLWLSKVSGRKTKHTKLRSPEVGRAYCPTQYKNK